MTSDTDRTVELSASLQKHKKFAADVRQAPLAFWDLQVLAATPCVCCNSVSSHISAYPFHSSGAFARQLIIWCRKCGFGMVPETSFPLDEYYRQEYAMENRGDREEDPANYFARMDSRTPPQNLARYRNRARAQVKRIREYVPSIGAMLDVGAGPGYALRVAKAKKSYALEYDEFSKKFLDHVGATMVDWNTVGDFRYDVILLSHTLEHFQFDDVLPRMTQLVDRLNPSGLLYIEVPPGGLGWKVYNYKHEPHTLFFTPEALQRLGEKLSLEILACKPVNKTFNKIEDRDRTIYKPEKVDNFDNPRGGLTLIAQKH